jgi:hypothetical protein
VERNVKGLAITLTYSSLKLAVKLDVMMVAEITLARPFSCFQLRPEGTAQQERKTGTLIVRKKMAEDKIDLHVHIERDTDDVQRERGKKCYWCYLRIDTTSLGFYPQVS